MCYREPFYPGFLDCDVRRWQAWMWLVWVVCWGLAYGVACNGAVLPDSCQGNTSATPNDPGLCCPGERACNAGSAFTCDDTGTWVQTSGCWAGTCQEGLCVRPDGAIENVRVLGRKGTP